MSSVRANRWGLVAAILACQAGMMQLPAGGEEPRLPGIRLFTPEPGGAVADNGYLVQWKDSDSPGYTIQLYRVEWPSQQSERINLTAIDAGNPGFSGNQYLWDTSKAPEGQYQLRADLLDPDGHAAATSRSEGFLDIRHEQALPAQEIYIYGFVHLKNQFLMDSERAGIARMLQACLPIC